MIPAMSHGPFLTLIFLVVRAHESFFWKYHFTQCTSWISTGHRCHSHNLGMFHVCRCMWIREERWLQKVGDGENQSQHGTESSWHLGTHMGSHTSSVQYKNCGAEGLRGFDASVWNNGIFPMASECRGERMYLNVSYFLKTILFLFPQAAQCLITAVMHEVFHRLLLGLFVPQDFSFKDELKEGD